jgi:hypothetical protein
MAVALALGATAPLPPLPPTPPLSLPRDATTSPDGGAEEAAAEADADADATATSRCRRGGISLAAGRCAGPALAATATAGATQALSRRAIIISLPAEDGRTPTRASGHRWPAASCCCC